MKIIVTTLKDLIEEMGSTARPIYVSSLQFESQIEGVLHIGTQIIVTAFSTQNKMPVEYRCQGSRVVASAGDEAKKAMEQAEAIEKAIREELARESFQVKTGMIADPSQVFFGEPYQSKQSESDGKS